jgi:hypothetical protein
MVSFRCKACGRLHSSGHAGEERLPASCSVCGAGVTFAPNGTKNRQADNWEVLADATPERLAELGLEPAQVEKHVPKKAADSYTEDYATCAANLALIEAKESAWTAAKDQKIAEWQQLAATLDAIPDDDPATEAAAKRRQLKAKMHIIECAEFTSRDESTKAVLQARIALGPTKPMRSGSSVLVRALGDKPNTVDKGK